MAVVICAGLATVPNELVVRAGADGPVPGTSQAMLEASLLSAPVVYLLLSGRLPFGMLLRLSLVVKAFALVAGALAASGPAADATGAAFHARAAANSLLSCALTDLALRVAPRGREAFGAILLAGVTQIVIVMANAAESTMGLPIALVGCVAAGAAVTATLTVSLLPGPVFESSRRAVVGSPA